MADAFLAYKRSKFNTRLPTDRVFTKSHFWVLPEGDGQQRVGFTRFATRMLGEVVEFDFEVGADQPIERGQTVGWCEGFKAVTELYSPLAGSWAGPNPDLDSSIGDIHKFPYDRGWLYRVAGDAPDDGLTAQEYAGFLDGTIDRMMGKSS